MHTNFRFSAFVLFAAFLAANIITPASAEERETAPGDIFRPNSENSQNPHSLFNRDQPYLENISAYEPIYFLVGTDPGKSKFQISFKYRFLSTNAPLAREQTWIGGFHIAYTQTSFWDLESDSEPFDDTSYKPELFYQSSDLGPGQGSSHVFLQTGFRHESNGRGGDLSRRTNFLYWQPIFIFYNRNTQFGLKIAPKFWAYVANDDETNRDFFRYRGYGGFEFTFGKTDGVVFASDWTLGKSGLSVQHDLTCPLDRIIGTGLQIYLHAQFVNAVAENLLDYKERTRAVRLGFSIVR